MTKDRILEIAQLGGETSFYEVEPVDIAFIAPLLAELRDALAKPYPNYTKAKLEDFEFQPYLTAGGGRTQLLVVIESKTGHTMISDPALWPGPRRDYWVIVAELAGLK